MLARLAEAFFFFFPRQVGPTTATGAVEANSSSSFTKLNIVLATLIAICEGGTRRDKNKQYGYITALPADRHDGLSVSGCDCWAAGPADSLNTFGPNCDYLGFCHLILFLNNINCLHVQLVS